MRKAKEKNKPLLSLAAAGLAALLLFGMATAVLAQGTQGKFVADEWSGIAEADIAEGDSTKDQAENQASTTPTPTPVSTQDESTALSDATPESAESSELTENKETDSDSNAEIPAEVSAFSNDLAVEEVSLYDASGTSAQDAVTSWTELKSAVASAANGATIYPARSPSHWTRCCPSAKICVWSAPGVPNTPTPSAWAVKPLRRATPTPKTPACGWATPAVYRPTMTTL